MDCRQISENLVTNSYPLLSFRYAIVNCYRENCQKNYALEINSMETFCKRSLQESAVLCTTNERERDY